MATGITIPIQTQVTNLQETISQIRSIANTRLNIDSSGAKELNKILESAYKNLMRLSERASHGITSKSELTSMENEIAKIRDGVVEITRAANNFSIKDIALTPEQRATLHGFDQERQASTRALNQEKAQVYERLVNSQALMHLDLDKSVTDQGVDAVLNQIEETFNNFGKIRTALNARIQQLRSEQSTYATEQEIGQIENQMRVRNFVSNGLGPRPENNTAAAVFRNNFRITQGANGVPQYNWTNANNTNANNAGNLFNEVAQAYGLSLEQRNGLMEQLRQQTQDFTAEAVIAFFQGLNPKALQSAGIRTDRVTKYRDYGVQIQNAERERTQLDDRQAAYQQAYNSDAYRQAREGSQNADEHARQREENIGLRQSTAEAEIIRGVGSAFQQINTQAEGAARGVDNFSRSMKQARSSLSAVNEIEQGFNHISMTISRYVGIAALVRNMEKAIRSAITNISDLDKTITGIAVVTNMTQDQLWGKINTYTQMAREYGVSLQDTYKVSQTFYQQGQIE